MIVLSVGVLSTAVLFFSLSVVSSFAHRSLNLISSHSILTVCQKSMDTVLLLACESTVDWTTVWKRGGVWSGSAISLWTESGGKCAFLAANVHKPDTYLYIYHCGNILSNSMIQCSAVTHMVSIGLRVGEKLVKKYCRLIYTHACPSLVLQLLLMNEQRSCTHCRHSVCERSVQLRSVALCVTDMLLFRHSFLLLTWEYRV